MFGQVTKVTCDEPEKIPPGGLRVEIGAKRIIGARCGISRTRLDCSLLGLDALASGVGRGVDVGAHHPHLIVFFVQVVQQNVTQ